jgi:hypothetical protein
MRPSRGGHAHATEGTISRFSEGVNNAFALRDFDPAYVSSGSKRESVPRGLMSASAGSRHEALTGAADDHVASGSLLLREPQSPLLNYEDNNGDGSDVVLVSQYTTAAPALARVGSALRPTPHRAPVLPKGWGSDHILS